MASNRFLSLQKILVLFIKQLTVMPRILFIILFVFSSQLNSYGQQNTDAQAISIPVTDCASVDALSSYINRNFTTDSTRIRAIYTWITNNINYDVARFLAREKSPSSPSPTAAQVLSSRSGVCQGYSDLFVSLCKGVGIEALRIGGYTKQQGKVSAIAHAWVAAYLDGQWYLFDPTWGAGYVKNDVFVKRYNNIFYKVPPAKFIADHMPFDPLYQYLSNPLSNQEFIDGRPASAKNLFNYADSIKLHNQLSFVGQTSAELRRLEAAGIQNNLLRERQVFLRQILQASASKDSFDEGIEVFKTAFSMYKEFMVHKRNQFSTITDNDLRKKVDSIELYVKKSRALVSETNPKTDAQRDAKVGQIGSIDKFWTELIRQKDFTTKFLATDKDKRKQLFMK
jgi:hypothetical protein